MKKKVSSRKMLWFTKLTKELTSNVTLSEV